MIFMYSLTFCLFKVDHANKKYTLSYDTAFNTVKSLTLGKFAGNESK